MKPFGEKRRIKGFLIALIVLGIPLLAMWWASRTVQNALVGPEHSFQLATAPPFLSEALAIEKAKGALALDGYDLARWSPREDRRSTAPDGTPDVYLVRNTINPNAGAVLFERRDDDRLVARLSVGIELVGDRVTCRVCLPK